MKNKGKFFKNPERGNNTNKPVQPYIPQWQVWGREPIEAGTGKTPAPVKEPQPTKHAPFIARTMPKPVAAPTISQNVPFAEHSTPSLGHARIPNVGNNIENTWAGIDEMYFDEDGNSVEIDVNQPMIDNNDDDLNNYSNIPKLLKNPPQPQMPAEFQMKEEGSNNPLADLEVDEYVLMIKGEIFMTGTLEEVQEEVRAFIFGEHQLSPIINVSIDDIVILKRIGVKVGVFLE